MKKLFFLAAFAVASFSVQAESFIGGKLGLQTQKTNDARLTTATLGVEAGHHINRNWALCAGIGYTIADLENGASKSTFELAPFARYTAARWGAVSLFFDGGVKMNWETHKNKYETTEFSWGMGISPGLAVQMSRRVTFVTNFGFVGYQGSENTDAVGFNFDTNNLRFGFHFTF